MTLIGVNMRHDLPKRKHPRLRDYDYSQNGYYHITVCTQNNSPILSRIAVGRGLAPADATANIELTAIGNIVEEQLLDLPNRFHNISIDKYVIMPTHIHVIIAISGDAAGASPRPTLMDAVRVLKSMSTRLCNQHDNLKGRKIWQTSFYDEVIQNEEAYKYIWQYIDSNPTLWDKDKYNRKE